MHVVVLASRKGGAGKTNISRHLAVQAEVDGAGPVAIIDADPMGGLTAWWNAREHTETPVLVETSLNSVGDTLSQLKERGFKTVIIDTPPAAGDAIRILIGFATLVVVPVRPSPDDLRAVGSTVDVAEEIGKPLLFVMNGAHHRAKVTAGAAIALSRHAPVCDVVMHQRTDYASSSANGMVVSESDPTSPSTLEVQALWRYVEGYLQQCATGRPRPSGPNPVAKSVHTRAPKGRPASTAA